MKIGIVPHKHDLTHPSDRRKFVRYCNIRNYKYEIANFNKCYDILYLSGKADITLWCKYKKKNNFKKTKIIFDASDPYIEDPNLYNIIRSLYYYLFGINKYFEINYANSFKKILSIADVIICASEEQKKLYKNFSNCIFSIEDYFDEDISSNLNSKNKETPYGYNFFWEGQSHANLSIFLMLRKILVSLNLNNINLHIVTDKCYCLLGGKYFCISTEKLLKKIFLYTNINVYFYSWDKTNLLRAAYNSDLGIIPIPTQKKRMQIKPENKLILMWSLGLPVISSHTKSNVRVMKQNNIKWYCHNLKEWKDSIIEFLESEEHKLDYENKIINYLNKYYTSNNITSKWDKVLNL